MNLIDLIFYYVQARMDMKKLIFTHSLSQVERSTIRGCFVSLSI
jgi:hypothetical protein